MLPFYLKNVLFFILLLRITPDEAIEIDFSLSNTIKLEFSNSPYLLTQDLIVPTNKILIIDPNVTLLFAPNTILIVDGSLIANGTLNKRIRLTSNQSLTNWKLTTTISRYRTEYLI